MSACGNQSAITKSCARNNQQNLLEWWFLNIGNPHKWLVDCYKWSILVALGVPPILVALGVPPFQETAIWECTNHNQLVPIKMMDTNQPQWWEVRHFAVWMNHRCLMQERFCSWSEGREAGFWVCILMTLLTRRLIIDRVVSLLPYLRVYVCSRSLLEFRICIN